MPERSLKRLLKNRLIGFTICSALIFALVIGGGRAIGVFAACDPHTQPCSSTQVTLPVNGGVLSESGPGTGVYAQDVQLDGTDQTTPYTLPIVVTDARGTGNGWNLTIVSTQFSTGASNPIHTLSTSASIISSLAVSCNPGAKCTLPHNTISPTGLGVPAAAGATPVEFFNATANTGMGMFTITPTISISIPAATYAGTYTSNVTVALVSGP
ncbi:MAG TPA: WxL domain-containing protein [Ktedonobacteraceae bacterium]|nr:WxL domain-containing protein [Ktedonobacteraceae bacterium]